MMQTEGRVPPGPLTKVLVNLDPDSPYATESLWTEPLMHDCYRINNVPFYA